MLGALKELRSARRGSYESKDHLCVYMGRIFSSSNGVATLNQDSKNSTKIGQCLCLTFSPPEMKIAYGKAGQALRCDTRKEIIDNQRVGY